MDKILKVAQREYLETVKTKIFILSVLFTPIFMAVIIFVMGQVQKRAVMGPRPAKEIAVTVRTAYKGTEVSRYNDGSHDYDIVVILKDEDRNNLEHWWIPQLS